MNRDRYHIDFTRFSLDQLKESLRKRKMIPSRLILKEELEERFRILTACGLRNLQDLLDALKSKDKMGELSERTGLSSEYLTILKREINSYHPNPVALSRFPGIDPEIPASLQKQGFRNSKQFFTKVNCGAGVDQLARETGIPKESLVKLAALSDLARLYGVGPVFAEIIYDAGIKSAEEFIRYSAEEFIRIYEERTRKKADFSISDIDFSMEIARNLTTD